MNKTDLPRAIGAGTLLVGDAELHVYILDDGHRVVSESSIAAAFTGNPRFLERNRVFEKDGGAPPAMRIEFEGPGGATCWGHDCRWFIELCRGFATVASNAESTPSRRIMSQNAANLLRTFSTFGIQFLIDQAARCSRLHGSVDNGARGSSPSPKEPSHSKSSERRRRRRARRRELKTVN